MKQCPVCGQNHCTDQWPECMNCWLNDRLRGTLPISSQSDDWPHWLDLLLYWGSILATVLVMVAGGVMGLVWIFEHLQLALLGIFVLIWAVAGIVTLRGLGNWTTKRGT